MADARETVARKTLPERLHATYDRWNNPPSPELPEGAGIVLEAAAALAAAQAEAARLVAEVERLTRERDKALKEMCRLASEAGEAQGKLAASEMAGIVDGWIERAKKAERERDDAMAALGGSRLARERAERRETNFRVALRHIADTWDSDKEWPGGDMEEAAAYASTAARALREGDA